jgi:UDP-N-acetylmuramyl-tripeptide synthetase/UDP-N-acetylmuramoyl-tripeptide--D-alanyl-D-alanine ligase
MRISELLRGIPFTGEIDCDFDGITSDSRRLEGENILFFAYKGTDFDSHQIAAELYREGKVKGVVSERALEWVPVVLTEDGRTAFCAACVNFFGNPQKELTLIGVTGTNGKTTVTYLLEKIYEDGGVVRIGTNGANVMGDKFHIDNTTPSPYDFFKLLRLGADKGAKTAIAEVSSHALSQGRLAGVVFDAAVFTNLTGDHLDYHGDMESYYSAKKLFFSDLYSRRRIINIDNPYGKRLFGEINGGKYSYGGFNPNESDLSVIKADFTFDGTAAVLSYKGTEFNLKSPLVGAHNLENIMAALCTAFALGEPIERAVRKAEKLAAVSGRLERYSNKGITVFVDYAHTDDALRRITATLKGLKKGKLITVFGAGGDRDKSKRPRMGKAVEENSDIAVVTSDNPRTETPSAIIDDILAGMGEKIKIYREEDRGRAIAFAISTAKDGDCVLVAGKGHEDYQIIGKTKRHFSDSEMVKNYLFGDLKLKDISWLIPCAAEEISEDISVAGAALDSREIKSGNLFFAAKGEKTDGALFAQAALNAGAAAVIMDNADIYEKVKGNKILVKDTLQALRELGGVCLAMYEGKRIAVTGSFGKTGVKDMLRALLNEKFSAYATYGNHNNELGVCLTAAGIPLGTEAAVFEIGSNAAGEIEFLAKLIKPNIAIVTGVGFAHIGRFGSLEETAREKLSVVNGLSDGGCLIANENLREFIDKFYPERSFKVIYFGETESADTALRSFAIAGFKARACYKTPDKEFCLEFPYPYKHLAVNFGAVLAAAVLLGLDESGIQKGLASFKLADGRGSILKGGGLYLIDDSYNASLDSILRAVEALDSIPLNGRKYAVLGGIGEIEGFDGLIYKRVYALAKERPQINFLFVGSAYCMASGGEKPSNVEFFDTADAIGKRLAAINEGIILLKASHSFAFSRFREEINKRVGLNAI